MADETPDEHGTAQVVCPTQSAAIGHSLRRGGPAGKSHVPLHEQKGVSPLDKKWRMPEVSLTLRAFAHNNA